VFVEVERNVIVLVETVLAKMLQYQSFSWKRRILGKIFQDVHTLKIMSKAFACVTDLRDAQRVNASVIPFYHHALHHHNHLEEIFCATAKFEVMSALAKETLAPAKRSRHATSTDHTLPRAHVIANKISDLWVANKSHRQFQANSRLTADAQHSLKSVQWILL
jgi:hypothetical protein